MRQYFQLEFCISIALETNSHKEQPWICEMKTSRHKLCWLCTSAFFKPWMDMTLAADSSALGLGPAHYKLHSREGLKNTAYFKDKCLKPPIWIIKHLDHIAACSRNFITLRVMVSDIWKWVGCYNVTNNNLKKNRRIVRFLKLLNVFYFSLCLCDFKQKCWGFRAQ